MYNELTIKLQELLTLSKNSSTAKNINKLARLLQQIQLKNNN